ncbi:MAG: hypothetical protein AAGD34_20150 [Pseudomonadota bacterium]
MLRDHLATFNTIRDACALPVVSDELSVGDAAYMLECLYQERAAMMALVRAGHAAATGDLAAIRLWVDAHGQLTSGRGDGAAASVLGCCLSGGGEVAATS